MSVIRSMLTSSAHQFLGVTCDNASNNDTMVTELDYQIDEFSEVNRIRCFLHIVNLIARVMLRQFDVNKRKKKPGEEVNDEWEEMLKGLAKDLEEEERLTQTFGNGVTQDDAEDDLVTDAEIDEALDMSAEELADLQAEIRPVMLVLVKVSTILDPPDQRDSPMNPSSAN